MSDAVEYRAATAADVEEIRSIVGAVDLFPTDMLDAMIADYLAGDSADIWFVANQPDGLLAFGFCEPERMAEGTWNLLALGTAPKAQGRGVGKGMLRYLESRLTAQGERIVLIETLGTPKFEPIRVFYLGNGYVE